MKKHRFLKVFEFSKAWLAWALLRRWAMTALWENARLKLGRLAFVGNGGFLHKRRGLPGLLRGRRAPQPPVGDGRLLTPQAQRRWVCDGL